MLGCTKLLTCLTDPPKSPKSLLHKMNFAIFAVFYYFASYPQKFKYFIFCWVKLVPNLNEMCNISSFLHKLLDILQFYFITCSLPNFENLYIFFILADRMELFWLKKSNMLFNWKGLIDDFLALSFSQDWCS